MHNPVFSVVMPTYNSERYVRGAVESVRQQTLADWELLVVDDASSDSTPRILSQLARDDARIKVIFLSANVGPAEARNTAIRSMRGRYAAFLDSDDLWRADKLALQLDQFERTGAALVYSAYEKIDDDGTRLGRVVGVPRTVTYEQLLGATVIATCTAAYDTKIIGNVSMPLIRKRQDFALWLQILRQGRVAQGLDEPLALLRKRPGSVSSNKLSALRYTWKVYRDIEHLSFGRALACFTRYSLHAAMKARI